MGFDIIEHIKNFEEEYAFSSLTKFELIGTHKITRY